MNSIEHGLRSYRNHDVVNKSSHPTHPLDVLSSILFDIKTENRHRENPSENREANRKKPQDEFGEILKKEMAR